MNPSYEVTPERPPAGRRLRAGRRSLAVIAALSLGSVLAGVAAPAVASANAANPTAGTTATGVVNADGTVTVVVAGTWSWPGQNCSQRYGVGWAVDWWGIGTSKTPSPSFPLTDATEVVPAGPAGKPPWSQTATTTGTVTPVGAIQLPKGPPPPPGQPAPPPSFFHVGTYYAGEDTDLCATVTANGTPYGAWSATATYPSQSDVPTALCANIYDEHGKAGQSSGNPKDFSPTGDDDNSIQTNAFDPTAAADSSCATVVISNGGGSGTG